MRSGRVWRGAEGTATYKWDYCTPTARSDGATSTHRLKTSSVSCSGYSVRAMGECCQDGQ